MKKLKISAQIAVIGVILAIVWKILMLICSDYLYSNFRMDHILCVDTIIDVIVLGGILLFFCAFYQIFLKKKI